MYLRVSLIEELATSWSTTVYCEYEMVKNRTKQMISSFILDLMYKFDVILSKKIDVLMATEKQTP